MGRLVALDAWRAVAIADLRGALVTLDAGATWKSLALPVEPVDVSAAADAIVVRGLDAAKRPQFWEVERDGQAGRLAGAPAAPATPEAPPVNRRDPSARAQPTVRGDRRRVASDRRLRAGRARRDARARPPRAMASSSRASRTPSLSGPRGATPSRSRLCRDPGAFGFVCGEPRAQTVVYRWDGGRSGLTEIRRFDDPREVLGFGNGALAVRGPCRSQVGDASLAGAPSEQGDQAEQTWCVMPPAGEWTERVFRGEKVDRARLVVLSDGRVALVRPPEAELATARLTLTDGARADHLALTFPLLHDDVTKALLHGIWLDGFEERRPGVLGGWVDAAGAVVGLEIALDGTVRVGEYIRDAGAPVASGRWAFGWTASRRAFETTDGGMTWTKGVEVPDPIATLGAVQERACGPVGCIAAGWLKVGWSAAGESPPPAPAVPMLPVRAARPPPSLHLRCERLPVEPVAASAAASARAGFPQPALVAAGTALPPFCGRPGPSRPSDNPAIVVEVGDGVGWPRRASPIAILYAWGPPGGEWDRIGRWEVRWRSLWGSCASSAGPAPWATIDAAARALGRVGGGVPSLTLVPGDDPEHALLVVRHPTGVDLSVLEAGRAPQDARRADGEAFPDFESAMQAGGHWYVASSQPSSQLPSTVVWRLEGGAAKEVTRIPRAGPEGRPSARLARSTSGRALGVVVEGRPDAAQGPELWIASVDLQTGEASEPEPLAPVDLSGRSVVPCTGDDEGWQVGWPYQGTVEVQLGGAPPSTLQTPFAALRLSRDRACVERVAGFTGDDLLQGAISAPPARLPGGRSVEVSIVSGRARIPLRCWFP